MRYLRLLSNAAIAGLMGAAYLAIVFLQLNPQVPLLSRAVYEWYAALCVLYGLHFAVTCYLLMLLLELFGLGATGPAWISVRMQAWISTVLCAVAAVLMWLNLRGFALTIGERAAQNMTAGALGVTGVALVLFSMAIVYYSVGRRGSRAAAVVLAIAVASSMALPLAARGAGAAVLLPIRGRTKCC